MRQAYHARLERLLTLLVRNYANSQFTLFCGYGSDQDFVLLLASPTSETSYRVIRRLPLPPWNEFSSFTSIGGTHYEKDQEVDWGRILDETIAAVDRVTNDESEHEDLVRVKGESYQSSRLPHPLAYSRLH